MFQRTLLLLTCTAVALAVPVRAATVRSDVDPQAALTLGAQPQYASVGRLDVDVFEAGPAAIGTGTLIAPDWVLTAAHVLDSAKAVQFTVNGQSYSATRWIDYRSYKGDQIIRGNDLALVQLSASITNITPATLYRGHSEFGQTATFVGYGLSGTGDSGAITDDRQRRAVTNTIDGSAKEVHGRAQLSSKPISRKAVTFAVDFDHPGAPSESLLGSTTPTAMEGIIAKGDSGGPVFLDNPVAGGPPLLAGVHSYGLYFDQFDDSDYGDVTGHTRVERFASWIDRVLDGVRPRSLQFVAPSQSFQEVTPMRLDPTDPHYLAALTAQAVPEAIPEPTTISLACAAGFVLLARRRLRS